MDLLHAELCKCQSWLRHCPSSSVTSSRKPSLTSWLGLWHFPLYHPGFMTSSTSAHSQLQFYICLWNTLSASTKKCKLHELVVMPAFTDWVIPSVQHNAWAVEITAANTIFILSFFCMARTVICPHIQKYFSVPFTAVDEHLTYFSSMV